MDIATLKMLLGITDNSKDFVLQFCLDNTTETILNYCNLVNLPDGLKNTGYRMAMDLYRNENLGSATPDGGLIASKSDGDTSVSFKENTSFTGSLLKNYEVQLNKYRKMSWT